MEEPEGRRLPGPLYAPGADHGNGGRYGVHKRNDFFVENLLGVKPPDWNHTTTTQEGSE